MTYVIWNVDQQAYVNQPGSKSSFTTFLQKARTFPSERAAQADCCGNEFPIYIPNELKYA